MKDSGRNQTLKKKQTTIQPIEAVAAAIQHKQAQILLDGRQVSCQLPGILAADRNALAMGDRVALEPVEGGQYRLTQVLARQGAVFRGDRRAQGKEILMAANVQLLLAVIPADCLLKQAGFPEAAAIAAGRAGVRFGLYVSKWDCIGESAQALLQERLEPYRPQRILSARVRLRMNGILCCGRCAAKPSFLPAALAVGKPPLSGCFCPP